MSKEDRKTLSKSPAEKVRSGPTWYEVELKMKSLVENKDELEGLVWRLGDTTGDVIEELLYTLEQYEVETDILKTTAQAAVDKMGAYKLRVEFIRKEIARVMSESDVDEFNCGRQRATLVQPRLSMEVVDAGMIPKEYLREQKPTPNRKAAMEWYKDKGTVIAGFSLGEGRSSVKVEWEVARGAASGAAAGESEGSEEE